MFVGMISPGSFANDFRPSGFLACTHLLFSERHLKTMTALSHFLIENYLLLATIHNRRMCVE